MSNMPTSEFDAVLRRYRREAVLLHLPYPPHAGPRTNSWLGGLPGLPAHLEWPRASDGTPLHLYAQVDCADIPFPTTLPDRGVLFFFGRDDQEHLWSDGDDPASDYCRVLYALDATAATPRREAPADLPQVGSSSGRYMLPGFAHERGRGPTLRDEWPIRPLLIPSWPQVLPSEPDPRLPGSGIPGVGDAERAVLSVFLKWRESTKEEWEDSHAMALRYGEEVKRLQWEAYMQATGVRPAEGGGDQEAGRTIFFHAEQGPQAYPQCWITVSHCAHAVLYQPANVVGSDRAVQAQLRSAAEAWLQRANGAGLDEAVPEAERGAFRAWLAGLRSPTDDAPLSYSAARLVFASTYATVRSWAGDRSRAARLPPEVYEALRYVFVRVSPRVEFWQMLGHAPSPQDPPPPDEPTVCLLADPGGFCKFWIEPEDLAQRDFSGVEGMLEWD